MIYDAVIVLKNGIVIDLPVTSTTGYMEAQNNAEKLIKYGVWIKTHFYPASMIDHVHLPEKRIDKLHLL